MEELLPYWVFIILLFMFWLINLKILYLKKNLRRGLEYSIRLLSVVSEWDIQQSQWTFCYNIKTFTFYFEGKSAKQEIFLLPWFIFFTLTFQPTGLSLLLPALFNSDNKFLKYQRRKTTSVPVEIHRKPRFALVGRKNTNTFRKENEASHERRWILNRF